MLQKVHSFREEGSSTESTDFEGIVDTVLRMRESQQNFQVNEGVIETVLWVWEEGGSTKSKVNEVVVETVLLMREAQ